MTGRSGRGRAARASPAADSAAVRVGRKADAAHVRKFASRAMCSATARIEVAFRAMAVRRAKVAPAPDVAVPALVVRAVRAVVRWVVAPVVVGQVLAVMPPVVGVPVVARWAPVRGVTVRAGAAPAERVEVRRVRERGVRVALVVARWAVVRAVVPAVRAVAPAAFRVAGVRRAVARVVHRIGVRPAACPAWSVSAPRAVCPACTMTMTSDAADCRV